MSPAILRVRDVVSSDQSHDCHACYVLVAATVDDDIRFLTYGV